MDINPVHTIFAAIAFTICFAIGAGVYHSIKIDELKTEAIKSNATPAQLVCAFNPPHENSARITMCGDTDLKLKEPK